MTNMDTIRDLFTENEWKYELKDNGTVLIAGFNVPCRLKSVRIIFDADPQKKFVRILGISPLDVDEENRAAVCEYLTRANYGFVIGGFEMDLRDGEVRYRIGIMDRDGTGVSKETIDHGMDIVLAMFTKYGDGLVSVMMGFSDPATEIEKVRKS